MEYAELSDRAKAYALATYGQPPDDWYECVYENAKEEGKERGFLIEDIQFSGFHSQGDGASWTGYIYLPDFITYHNEPDADDFAQYTILAELIRDGWCEESMTISRNGFYYNHSGTMQSSGVDDRIHYADDDSVVDRGILEGANVKELAKSINTDDLFIEIGRAHV